MCLESNRAGGSLGALLFVLGVIVCTLWLSRGSYDAMAPLLLWGCTLVLAAIALLLLCRAGLRRIAGRTTVELDEHPLVRGQSTGLRIYHDGGRMIERLTVHLSCSTTRAEGMDIESVRVRALYTGKVAEAENLHPVRGEPVWEGELRIPDDSGASTAAGNKWWRTWGLSLEMKIPGRISVEEIYTLQVDDPVDPARER